MFDSVRITASDGTEFVTVDAYLAHLVATNKSGSFGDWLARGLRALTPKTLALECAPTPRPRLDLCQNHQSTGTGAYSKAKVQYER